MSNTDIHVPETSAHRDIITKNPFFHNLQLPDPRWASQHETVSTTAGMQIPRKEKNIAPISAINGSNSGTNMATLTVNNIFV